MGHPRPACHGGAGSLSNPAVNSLKVAIAAFGILAALVTAVFGYGQLHTQVVDNAKELTEVHDALHSTRTELGMDIREIEKEIRSNDAEIVDVRERLSRIEEGQKNQTQILGRIERILDDQYTNGN